MTLSDWLDYDLVVSRLVAANMRLAAARNIAHRFIESASDLLSLGVHADREVIGCWAPGRIEVLGKHTDYCGGQSLLAAAELGFCMIAVPSDDDTLRLVDARRKEQCEFRIDAELQPTIGSWSNYPQTVARRLARNFPGAWRGATIAFSSNLPLASGMSSSSAFVVGTFLLVADINRLSRCELYQDCIRGMEDLCEYLGAIENGSSFGPLHGDRGVGTFGGSEDHTAILCARPEGLALFSFCPVRHERSLTLARDYIFAIASSGIVAEKTGDALPKYNRISALATDIVQHWNRATNRSDRSVNAILASAHDAEGQLRSLLSKDNCSARFSSLEMRERLDHFLIENRDIQSNLPDSILPATIERFSALATQSQDAGIRLLKNQIPQTIRLVEMAVQCGAHASTAFGAGFGGSVWALIDCNDESRFLADWQEQYRRNFSDESKQAAFFTMRPGPAAIVWND